MMPVVYAHDGCGYRRFFMDVCIQMAAQTGEEGVPAGAWTLTPTRKVGRWGATPIPTAAPLDDHRSIGLETCES